MHAEFGVRAPRPTASTLTTELDDRSTITGTNRWTLGNKERHPACPALDETSASFCRELGCRLEPWSRRERGELGMNRTQRIGTEHRNDGHTVDASALRADEGRGIAAISVGEPRAGVDPPISEWGNPTAFGCDRRLAEGTGGTETSHVPRGTEIIPVVAASEPGAA